MALLIDDELRMENGNFGHGILLHYKQDNCFYYIPNDLAGQASALCSGYIEAPFI